MYSRVCYVIHNMNKILTYIICEIFKYVPIIVLDKAHARPFALDVLA